MKGLALVRLVTATAMWFQTSLNQCCLEIIASASPSQEEDVDDEIFGDDDDLAGKGGPANLAPKSR